MRDANGNTIPPWPNPRAPKVKDGSVRRYLRNGRVVVLPALTPEQRKYTHDRATGRLMTADLDDE